MYFLKILLIAILLNGCAITPTVNIYSQVAIDARLNNGKIVFPKYSIVTPNTLGTFFIMGINYKY